MSDFGSYYYKKDGNTYTDVFDRLHIELSASSDIATVLAYKANPESEEEEKRIIHLAKTALDKMGVVFCRTFEDLATVYAIDNPRGYSKYFSDNYEICMDQGPVCVAYIDIPDESGNSHILKINTDSIEYNNTCTTYGAYCFPYSMFVEIDDVCRGSQGVSILNWTFDERTGRIMHFEVGTSNDIIYPFRCAYERGEIKYIVGPTFYDPNPEIEGDQNEHIRARKTCAN